MPPADLLTDRLRLAPWRPEHAAFLAELVAQPEMVRYIGDGRPLGPEGVAERASFAAAHWLARGWGWRVAHELDGDAPVAIVAANRLGEGTRGLTADEYEIGWFVTPRRHRSGYAVEAAAAVLDELLGRVGAPSAIARIQPANAGSVRVAERLGMTRERSTTGRYGEPLLVYRRLA